MNVLGEIWRPLPNSALEVSSAGRLRRRINVTHPERNKPWLYYKAFTDEDGYARVRLRGDRRTFVHRMVYEAHVGPIPEGMVVCHKDGNPQNNAVENLVAATQKENLSHKAHHGTAQRGERHANAKYSDELVQRIRTALLPGDRNMAEIARNFGVPYHFVADIKYGRRHLRC